ncbi:MAG: S8 family peptidase [Bacteroidales bacterium]|nr:S8 family peptidase [Bacteroidales bacterium]
MIFYILRIILTITLVFTVDLTAQIKVAPGRYRVEFTDKSHNVYTVDRPGDFLSDRAIERRKKQNIHLTQKDLPVSQYYIDSISKLGMKVLNVSKWFNSIVVKCDEKDLGLLDGISFVKKNRLTPGKKKNGDHRENTEIDLESIFSSFFQSGGLQTLYGASDDYYGKATTQIGMLGGHVLHNSGYRGKGMLIAVIDGGFYNVDLLSGFDRMHHEDRLVRLKNFTIHEDIFGQNNHGSNVLSIIAADLPGRMVGSAPDADYLLLRSEEIGTEYLVEEDNWISAVEFADSIGVDLVSTSLGYSIFDDTLQNHVWTDLDGRTTRASYAATMASARGIIVCLSAGNDGDRSWRYVSVPGDADSILTIGAVDRQGKYASFSSIGPTADGRIKPDLTAMGKTTAYQGSMGQINSGNGTSYSTPLLAGFMACLWQAHPDKNNMEIIQMVKESADRYNHPDSLYGYGIPDFAKLIPENTTSSSGLSYKMSIFPDPFSNKLTIRLSPARHGNVNIRILSVTGQSIYEHTAYVIENDAYELLVEETVNLDPGIFIVESQTDIGMVSSKFVK